MIKKTVIINRAVPGSGKTTITNCIVDTLKQNNITVAVHSTDEYYMVGNKYIFDIKKLGEYHNKNLENFKNSILDDTDIVICDNTNIAPWQTEPYTKLARKYNYNIIFITLNPRELQKHIESQRVTTEKPDAHGVCEDVLKMMIDEYFIYDDLLNKNTIINKDKHINYKWYKELNEKIKIDIAKYFDSDYIIRILPNEYLMVQNKIGREILELVTNKSLNVKEIKKVKMELLEKSKNDYSSLHIAIIYNDIELIKFFLENNIDIETKYKNSLTPIEFALFKGNYKIIKEFNKFFPNEVKEYILENWDSTLHLATYLEDIHVMKQLIEKGANINIKNEQGYTSLHIAINCNNIEIVKFLIKEKADINIDDNYGNTPVILALKENNIEIIKHITNQYTSIKPISKKVIIEFYSLIDNKEYIETLKIFIQIMDEDVNEKVHFDFFKEIFNKDITDINKSIIRIFLDNGLDINNKLNKNNTVIQYAKKYPEKYNWFLKVISERTNTNPHKLIKLLSSFSIEKPIKFTTHDWDFGKLSKSKYKNFDGYMNEVKNQWLIIKDDLEIISPNLFKKINNFLWETDSNISLGWSSINGLKEWCDADNNPFDFKNFKEVISSFKKEIEIRKDTMLEDIFIQERKKLGRKYKVELIKLKGVTFYTDTEKLTNVIKTIFSQISELDRQIYTNIKVEVTGDSTKEFIELKIVQEDATSGSSANVMLEEIKNGDFSGIKENLKNLCDWSIESSHEDKNYRVNYLKSNNSQDIEELKNKPIGFTHILRFYNK